TPAATTSTIDLIKPPLILLLLQYSALTYPGVASGHHSLHTDKTVLLELRKTIIFDPKSRLSNWIESMEVCNFTGVYYNKHHHRVVKIDLSTSELTARISPIISNLTRLRALHLYTNNFYGSIPPAFFLALSYNNLSGGLPGCLALLSQLSILLLDGKHLSVLEIGHHDQNTNLEPYFSALANCTSLQELELADIGLGGRLASTISKLSPNLKYLLLQENRIFGSILVELTHLPQLTLLNLTSNFLNGTIPREINRNCPSSINCIDLSKLDLSHNRLTGTIPPEIPGWHDISIFLNLSHNHLEGPLPIKLSKLENVQEIDFSSNNFTGSITFVTVLDYIHTWTSILCNTFLPDFHQPHYLDHKQTISEQSEATEGFDEQRIISECCYRRVYKGVLQDGSHIAVK
ncbi:hypothetical protein Tsubulata_038633, partial [Turnera subulata]